MSATISAAASHTKVIIAFGDSTTAPRHGVITYSQILKLEVDTLFINSGVPGNTTDDARKRFGKDVLARHPNLVIIQFGLNDSAVDVWKNPPATGPQVSLAHYRDNLNYFVNTLERQRSKVILMTPNPQCWTRKLKELYGKPPYRIDEKGGMNVILVGYVRAMREIANTRQIALVDVFRSFSAHGAPRCSLLSDGMHPNDRGQRLIANLLLPLVRTALAAQN